ncbi:hypothetical protein ACQP1O_28860 [Nocardia sp. CA-151230]|uniref:hypothetical protein n=1 Tax=Nocardia sp. CA-151230 TaxID=3239982 RepID=UPI003D8D7EA0
MSKSNSYPFVVDEPIVSRLDSSTLHAIGRNVWPVELPELPPTSPIGRSPHGPGSAKQ